LRELNVVVWGLGPHATKNILPAIDAVPELNLYGVCSRNRDVVAAACHEYGCVGWSESDRLLGDPRVDAVYLATPIGLHASHGHSVLSAGKHLWCEKPLAEGPDQVEHLVALARAEGLTLGEGFMYLHHPQFEALRRTVESGRLGQVHTVTCRFGIPALERPGFRLSPELGGGAFLDVGIYPISAMVALFPADPTVVFAEIATTAGSPVDTDGRALLRYSDGCSGTVEWRTGVAYRNEIDVWGAEGSVSSERIFSKPADHVPQLRFLDLHGTARYEWVEAANHFVRMLSSFRRLVEDENRAERERELIARRARLVGAIRDYSQREE
jgi:NDP-hexose-3-ketoreductase